MPRPVTNHKKGFPHNSEKLPVQDCPKEESFMALINKVEIPGKEQKLAGGLEP